jgi:multicomponent Na+:H+ antiporter subunit E
MKEFLANIILAITWAAASGEITLAGLAVGFAVGYVILWFGRPVLGTSRYFEKLPKAVSFILFYLRQLALSNLKVAYDIVTPTNYMKPGMIGVTLDAETDAEITLLANLITMTPGTLSVDVSDDRRTLYIHAMYIDDVEAFRREIKDGFERRLLDLMR